MVATASRSGLRHSFMGCTSLARGTSSWAALLLQELPLLCEHNLRVLPQTKHPCGHTIGTRFCLPFFFKYRLVCDFGYCAVHFLVFCIVAKKFPVAYPTAVSFQRVFWAQPLSHCSFSNEELFGRLFCRCPFPAYISVTYLASLSLYDDFISSV